MSKKYTINWKTVRDDNPRHTACTMYEADNFVIWKGKKQVMSVIRSADEWHLIRKSDNKELHYAKTAKECKDLLEHSIKNGMDIDTAESLFGYYGMKFDDDFNITW